MANDEIKEGKSKSADYLKELLGLVRYPVIGASIVLSIWFAEWAIGFDIGNISEMSTTSIKFRQDASDLAGQIVPLAERVKFLEVSIQTLLKKDSAKNNIDIRNTIMANAADLQTATDKVTQISEMKLTPNDGQSVEGFIWIGNFDKRSNRWSTVLLGEVDKATPPADIQSQVTYTVEGNMILRQSLPKDNRDYFRSVASLGIIPKNSKITLLEKPTAVDREFTIQYWVRVRWSK